MAINPSTNPTMSGRVTAADADYPFGSAKDETSPGAGDGSPYFKARADDVFGWQQWLLDQASIVPSGNADTVLVSDYGDALKLIIAANSGADKKQWPTVANNSGDALHDLDFNAGRILNNGGDGIITLTSTLIKQLDAAWAAGDAVGGLFTGTITADTTYHCFLIVKDSDGSIDAGFDTSIVASSIPAGWTAFRRIASILTDASANILPFVQFGDRFMHLEPINDFNSNPSTSGVLQTVSVPNVDGIEVILDLEVAFSGTSLIYISSPAVNNVAPGAVSPLTISTSSGATNNNTRINAVIINQEVRQRSSTVSPALTISSVGWVDERLT